MEGACLDRLVPSQRIGAYGGLPGQAGDGLWQTPKRFMVGRTYAQSRRLVRPLQPLQPPLIEPCVRFSLTRLSDDVHVAAVAALP